MEILNQDESIDNRDEYQKGSIESGLAFSKPVPEHECGGYRFSRRTTYNGKKGKADEVK